MQKKFMCHIDFLNDEKECFWIISVNIEDISTIVTLFSALTVGKIDALILVDTKKPKVSPSQLVISYDPKKGLYSIEYDGRIIKATHTWATAILGLLTETWLCGWSNTAHIDQEFARPDGTTTLCLNILPPK